MSKYRCVLCEGGFDDASPEHFILESLGGFRASSVVDCTSCNHVLNEDCDDPFSAKFKTLRTLLGIKRQSGKPAPSLRKIDLGIGFPVDIAPKGKPSPPGLGIKRKDE